MINRLMNRGTEINFDIDKIDRETKDAVFTLYDKGVITGGQMDIIMDMAYKKSIQNAIHDD